MRQACGGDQHTPFGSIMGKCPWFSGLNVTPCSAKELAGAIMTITRNDDLYQKLAKGARERYQETFTKEK